MQQIDLQLFNLNTVIFTIIIDNNSADRYAVILYLSDSVLGVNIGNNFKQCNILDC